MNDLPGGLFRQLGFRFDSCALYMLQDMLLVAAMGPPGGGRTIISKRLQSRFNLINMTFPQVSWLNLRIDWVELQTLISCFSSSENVSLLQYFLFL